MNPRPPGYEPGELPDCSTPRRCPDCSTLVTIVPMWDWAVWAALIGGGIAAVTALALLGMRVLEAWRAFKAVRGNVFRQLGELEAKGEETAERAAAAGDTAELQESVVRLRVSLARLAVLREALGEAQDVVGHVRVVMPRK